MATTKRGYASGTFSYHKRGYGPYEVYVANMPEECLQVRIVFSHQGETLIPILKISVTEAECLWAALSDMAKDLKWEFDDAKETK